LRKLKITRVEMLLNCDKREDKIWSLRSGNRKTLMKDKDS
jgi:hypothetical protein